MRAQRVGTTLLGLLATSCAIDASAPAERSSTVVSSIVGGRVSGDDESFVTYLESGTPGSKLRCSSTLIAPNVVLTARHCVLAVRSEALACNPDGTLTDPTDPRAQNQQTEDAANIHVFYGQNHSSLVSVGVTQVFVPIEIGICRNDLALLVLDKPLADVHVALRMTPVVLGEKFSVSGWGYTGDGQAPNLPESRSGLDNLRINEVGPGLIPSGTFATPGNTMCFGDSGSGARIAGSVVGVYSRIEGGFCTLAEGRNVFMMVAPHRALIDAAFAKAGTKAWYAGEPKPWLAAPGAACKVDSDCQLEHCDTKAGICAAPCSASPTTCATGYVCDTALGSCVEQAPAPVQAEPPAEAPPPSVCGYGPVRQDRRTSPWAAAALLSLAVGALRRRRSE